MRKLLCAGVSATCIWKPNHNLTNTDFMKKMVDSHHFN